jgi:hypothetical protein
MRLPAPRGRQGIDGRKDGPGILLRGVQRQSKATAQAHCGQAASREEWPVIRVVRELGITDHRGRKPLMAVPRLLTLKR